MFDLSRITPVQAAGLADLRIDEYESSTGRVKRTRVKLGPKTRALELLGKHLKLWSDRVEPAQNTTLNEKLKRARERILRGMSDDELTAKIQELQAQLEARHPKRDIQFVTTESAK